MLAFSTYCSANKKHSTSPIPAIELYKSQRIAIVYSLAEVENSRFVTLSGKYGLVDAQQEIEEYDHLLSASEVEHHSDIVASQIKEKNISEIIFFMNSIKNDHKLKPYLECIMKACDKTGINIEIKEKSFID